jgi:hypothetical protein
MKPMVTGDAPIDQPSKWLRSFLRRGFCYTAILRDIWPTELRFQAGFLMCDFTHVGCLPLKSGYQTKFKQKINFQERHQSGWSWTTQLNKLIDLSVAGFRNQGFRAESRSPQVFSDGAYLAVWDSQSYWNLLRKIIGWRIHHSSIFPAMDPSMDRFGISPTMTPPRHLETAPGGGWWWSFHQTLVEKLQGHLVWFWKVNEIIIRTT